MADSLGSSRWLYVSGNNLSSIVYTPSHNLITLQMAPCFQHIYNIFVRICHICRGLMNHRMSVLTTLSILQASVYFWFNETAHAFIYGFNKTEGEKKRRGGEWMLIPQPDEKDLESSSISPLLWGIDGKNNKERHWLERKTAMAINKNCKQLECQQDSTSCQPGCLSCKYQQLSVA